MFSCFTSPRILAGPPEASPPLAPDTVREVTASCLQPSDSHQPCSSCARSRSGLMRMSPPERLTPLKSEREIYENN